MTLDAEGNEQGQVDLQKQLDSTQHILGHVLLAVGQPVEVKKSALADLLGEKYRIEMSETDDAFVFSLESI